MILFEKNNLIVRDFVISDIQKIKNNVRDIDTEDIKELFNMTPEKSLLSSVKVSSHVFTVCLNQSVVAILGLLPDTLLSDKALIWMVSSNTINKVPIGFLRGSKIFKERLFKLYRLFHGIVRNENVCSLKWIRWIGADMLDHGIFHSFKLEKV